MANVIYNNFKRRLFANGVASLNWTDPGTTVKVLLTTNSYVPNEDTHEFRSSVTNEIPNGGGYTSGGMVLPGKSLAVNNTSNAVTLNATTATWANSTITNARYAVLYIDTGNVATDILIAAYDFGVDKSSSNDNFSFVPNASGLIVLT